MKLSRRCKLTFQKPELRNPSPRLRIQITIKTNIGPSRRAQGPCRGSHQHLGRTLSAGRSRPVVLSSSKSGLCRSLSIHLLSVYFRRHGSSSAWQFGRPERGYWGPDGPARVRGKFDKTTDGGPTWCGPTGLPATVPPGPIGTCRYRTRGLQEVQDWRANIHTDHDSSSAAQDPPMRLPTGLISQSTACMGISAQHSQEA